MKFNLRTFVSLAVFCALTLLTGAAAHAADGFTVAFKSVPKVTDGDIAFGAVQGATDGLDNGVDYPPMPQFDPIVVPLTFKNSLAGDLWKDMRAPTVPTTWSLEVSGLSQAMTLQWTVSDVSAWLTGKSLLIFPHSNPGSSVNMVTSASTSVTNGLYDIVLRTDNSQPNAVADTATLFLGSESTKLIDVLANDSDPDPGQTPSLFSVQSPTAKNGTAVISAGKILYTPLAGFKGEDSFTYVIRDNASTPAQATALVTVLVEDQIYAKRTHSASAAPGTEFTAMVTVYYAASVTSFRILESLPVKNGGTAWDFANSATATNSCTVTPAVTSGQLSLTVTPPPGGALPTAPGPVIVTYKITVPADTSAGTSPTLKGDLFVNGGNTPVGAVPQTSFTISLYHAADSNHDWSFSGAEVLRVINLKKFGPLYHSVSVDATNPDGYTVGAGTVTSYHSADYDQNGSFSGAEVLRVINLKKFGPLYHPVTKDATNPDGYTVGAP